MTHDDLVTIAKKWLIKARQCVVVLTETQAQSGETPDAIGWRGQVSILIECKTSLADFRRDLKKWYRNSGPGIGQRRYFMAPKGVIPVDEIPPNWGLLEVEGNKVTTKKKIDLLYLDERVSSAEVPMLVAALRRSQVRKRMRARRRKSAYIGPK
jgi:hypothetical protein